MPDYQRLDAQIPALITAAAVLGLALAVVEEGAASYARGFGMTTAGDARQETVRDRPHACGGAGRQAE